MNKTYATLLATFPWAPGVRENILPEAGYEELCWAVGARRDFSNEMDAETDLSDLKEAQLNDLWNHFYYHEIGKERVTRFLDLFDERPCFYLSHAQVDQLFPDIDNRWDQMAALQGADPLIVYCYYIAENRKFCIYVRKLDQYEFLKPLAESNPRFWQETVLGN